MMPLDNVGAGLPAADKIVNDYISSVAVESGAIQVTFGNHANVAVQGKVLTLRPAVVERAGRSRDLGLRQCRGGAADDRPGAQQDDGARALSAAVVPGPGDAEPVIEFDASGRDGASLRRAGKAAVAGLDRRP